MTVAERPIVGTIGLKIKADVDFDISGAGTLELHYIKPDGTYGIFSGTYELDGTKHTISYVTLSADDIDQEGRWTFQAYVEMGSSRFWGTEDKTERFKNKLS
jgi:hypothetical protein